MRINSWSTIRCGWSGSVQPLKRVVDNVSPRCCWPVLCQSIWYTTIWALPKTNADVHFTAYTLYIYIYKMGISWKDTLCIYVYIYVYIYICIYIYVYICIYIYTGVYIYVYINTYINIYIQVYIYICKYICKYMYIYICIYVNVYIYICICICIYLYIYIYNIYIYIICVCTYIYIYCICVYIYIYVCILIYAYIYIYLHIYINTYTYITWFPGDYDDPLGIPAWSAFLEAYRIQGYLSFLPQDLEPGHRPWRPWGWMESGPKNGSSTPKSENKWLILEILPKMMLINVESVNLRSYRFKVEAGGPWDSIHHVSETGFNFWQESGSQELAEAGVLMSVMSVSFQPVLQRRPNLKRPF